jgi:hypothetical protein
MVQLVPWITQDGINHTRTVGGPQTTVWETLHTVRDVRDLPRFERDLHSSVTLLCVDWWLVSDVSG